MSIEPTATDHEVTTGTPEELAGALPELVHRALRARIYDRRGKSEPARKRRDRVASSLLVDLTDVDSVAALARALRLRPDTEIMDWMQPPDLWIEFTDEHGMPLVVLGWLRPDWLRWEPHGDLQLAAPELVEGMVSSWF